MHDEPEDAPIEEKLDDHRACMRVVAEVERCLHEPPDREGRWSGRMLEALNKLRGTLAAHFKVESGEPLFRTIPTAHPRFAGRLSRLESEHEGMLEELDQVVRQAEGSQSRIYEQRELNGRIQLLIAKIRRHEAEENEILIEAYWDEVGVGD